MRCCRKRVDGIELRGSQEASAQRRKQEQWEHPMTKNSASLNRTLFIADNLDLLKSLDNESIDLICIDPPFAKNQTWVGALRPPLSKEEREQELATLAELGDSESCGRGARRHRVAGRRGRIGEVSGHLALGGRRP